jgi:hypothetical protein
VLDDVAVGPFTENPARKDAIPFVVALILHRQLDKGAGFGRVFPRRSRLARAQANDRTADSRCVARLHLDIADQPVTLVEQADHRDAFTHRGRAFDAADFLRHAFGFRDLRRLVVTTRLGGGRPVAGDERNRHNRRQTQRRGPLRHGGAHSAPGRQAS